MSSVITESNDLTFELNQKNLTAKIIRSPKAKDRIFIPRSVHYQSQEYVITSIEKNAFKNNFCIYSIEFSEDSELKKISERAFIYSALKTIQIPSTVELLEDGWCMNMKELINVYISNENKHYKSLDKEGKIIVGKSNEKNSNETKNFESYNENKNNQSEIHKSNDNKNNNENNNENYKENNNESNNENDNENVNESDDENYDENYNENDDEFDILVFVSRDIKVIQIPSTIKRICPYCFDQSDLKKIIFDKNSKIEIIGKNAFNNSHLLNFEIPPTVKQLEDGWYGSRWKDVCVSISPENKFFKCINDSLIVGKSNQKEEEFDVLVFANSEIVNAKIPSSIKHISSNTFFHCQMLQKVEFESNSKLISIGDNTFSYTKINEISIPKSCKSIGKHAFESCGNLKSISLPSDSELISIPSHFFEANSVKSFTIPKSVKKLDQGWISNCEHLINVVISSENDNFLYLDDDHKIILRKSDYSLVYDTIAFACRDITKVFIPSTIKYIDSYAFNSCKELKKIDFSNDCQLKSIGKRAFANLPIDSFDLPSSVVNISYQAFAFCKALKSFNIHKNSQLESIDELAFFYSPVEKLYLPTNLNNFFFDRLENINIEISPDNKNFKFLDEEHKIIIGKYYSESDVFDEILFAHRDIEKVSIPSFIKYINEQAFMNCRQLDEVTFSEDSQLSMIEIDAFVSTNIQQIKIPSQVEFIGESCFQTCSNLQKVEFETNSKLSVFVSFLFDSSNIECLSFPSSINTLRSGWCSGTPRLNHIYLPSENTNFNYLDKEHKIIGQKSNQNIDVFDVIVFACRDIKNVSIPSTITKIESYAFSDCIEIHKLFIPKKLEVIESFAFYNCNKLKTIEFEEKSMINKIGYHSFGKSLIEDFTIPEKMKSIDLNMFLSIDHLHSIEFLSDELTFDGFLCANLLYVISLPNANKICIDIDSFMIFSNLFSLFTLPNVKIEC